MTNGRIFDLEILVFSDSHGRWENMREAMQRQVTRASKVFFLGDGLRDLDELGIDDTFLHAVRGNCDWFAEMPAPTETLVDVEGHTVLATHGHTFGVKGGLGALLSHASEVGADVVLFGHTHAPLLETVPAGSVIGGNTLTRPIYLFNPGSIGYDGSFGTIVLKNREILFSHGRL